LAVLNWPYRSFAKLSSCSRARSLKRESLINRPASRIIPYTDQAISRVENGHSVPAIETLEQFARALEVPMYQLFVDVEGAPKLPHLAKHKAANCKLWGSSGKEGRLFPKLCRLFKRMQNSHRRLLLFMA
jgi:transcriptional regulator with XRE-family HTH domain